MIHMDQMVWDFSEVNQWLRDHQGVIENNSYIRGLYRSASVFFYDDFVAANEFLTLKGVRRAIIAYWTEALMELQEKNIASVYERYHHWNAIAELKRRIELNLI